jgi:hypothetical protein
MMHMFKNLSTVKDYNHSEVDGDARNRMRSVIETSGKTTSKRQLRETTGAGTAERAMQVVQSAAVPGFKAASVFDPSTERSETISSRSSLRPCR